MLPGVWKATSVALAIIDIFLFSSFTPSGCQKGDRSVLTFNIGHESANRIRNESADGATQDRIPKRPARQSHQISPSRNAIARRKETVMAPKHPSQPLAHEIVNASSDWLEKMVERIERVKRFSRLVGVVMKLENCESSQCNNGATCLTNVLYEGGFECLCKVGYYGPLCDQTAEECMINPCLNGGMCVAVFDGYTCGCPDKFSGVHCEISTTRAYNAWYSELGLDRVIGFSSFAAFVASMCGLVVAGTFCCIVENKKVKLRQQNDQHRKMARTMGMFHLRDQEFVNSGYLNALAEVAIDGAYGVSSLVARLIDLPSVVSSFARGRSLRAAKEVENRIGRYYARRKKRSEWWSRYVEVRNRMRLEEVQTMVGRELKKALEEEMKRVEAEEREEEAAAEQLREISKMVDEKAEEGARRAGDGEPKVPMTTMKNMALGQGVLSAKFIELLERETRDLEDPLEKEFRGEERKISPEK